MISRIQPSMPFRSMPRNFPGQRYVVVAKFASRGKWCRKQCQRGAHITSPDLKQALLTSHLTTQIFSRHESVLSTHLKMLDSVKEQVASDEEAFRAISSMVNKTVQAMNQFKVVRKHMVCYSIKVLLQLSRSV